VCGHLHTSTSEEQYSKKIPPINTLYINSVSLEKIIMIK
jgi:hypothetical protein